MSDENPPDFRPSAWDAIKADPQLARARQKLSAHELKLIIEHAQSAPVGKPSETEMRAAMDKALSDLASVRLRRG